LCLFKIAQELNSEELKSITIQALQKNLPREAKQMQESMDNLSVKSMKKPLRALIGNHDNNMNDLISEIIKEVIDNKYDLIIHSSFHSEEILEIAEQDSIDIFIIILNNIKYTSDSPYQGWVENAIGLITQIKTIYVKPVIVFSGISDNPSLIDKAKQVSDFFFLLPFEPESFIKAIEKCFEMLPDKKL
jgi:hypothetical protein